MKEMDHLKTLATFEGVGSLVNLNNTQRSGLLLKSNHFVSIKDHSNPITAKVQTKKGVEHFGIS
jgi:hypothetical protein